MVITASFLWQSSCRGRVHDLYITLLDFPVPIVILHTDTFRNFELRVLIFSIDISNVNPYLHMHDSINIQMKILKNKEAGFRDKYVHFLSPEIPY